MARNKPKRRGPIFRWLWRAVGLAILLSLALVLPLRWIDPPSSAFMLRERLSGHPVDYRWVDLGQMGSALPIAIVASEDQKFPLHQGFDVQSMREALTEGANRGASTITQQVAKNLYLWPGRSWLRKGVEAWFTLLIEACWSKHRILEIYLNVAQFGPGLYGVEAAAQYYFGRSADQMDLQDAARLATVLPSPSRIDPRHRSEYVDERSTWILDQVEGLGGARYLSGLD